MNRDRESFERYFRDLYRPLVMYALKLTGDKAEAMDAVQESFIRAAAEPDFLSDGFNRRAWLYKVVTNQSFSIMRKLRRGMARFGLTKASPDYGSGPATQDISDGGSGDPAEIASGRDEINRLLEALKILDRRGRTVLVLKYFEGLSCNEISETLGMPSGTVMTCLDRARKRLRKVLGDERSAP